MAPRPTIGDPITLRIDPDLLARIDAEAARQQISRAQYVREAVAGSLTVQAPRFTEGYRRSDSELARIVANHSGWSLDLMDQLVDQDGDTIAYSIEDAAAAMLDLGWFHEDGRGVAWSMMREDRADKIRRGLDHEGKHPRING